MCREALKPRNRIETRDRTGQMENNRGGREALKPRNRIETCYLFYIIDKLQRCREALKPRNRIETLLRPPSFHSFHRVAKL